MRVDADGETAQLDTGSGPDRGTQGVHPGAPGPPGHRPPAHASRPAHCARRLPSGVVTGVRFGSQPGGTLRVVVQLNSALVARTCVERERSGTACCSQPGHEAGACARGRRMRSRCARRTPRAKGTATSSSRSTPATAARTRARSARRHAREGRDARHRARTGGAHQRRAGHARGAHARPRRVPRAARPHAPGARGARRTCSSRCTPIRSPIAASRAPRCTCCPSTGLPARRRAGSPSARMPPTSWAACAWMTRSALASVLLDPPQTARSSAMSASAAERVLSALDDVGEVRKAQVQQAGFVVLKSPDIPSMLVETAYISNPAEERRLRTASQQEPARRCDLRRLARLLHAEPARWHALQAAAAHDARQRPGIPRRRRLAVDSPATDRRRRVRL